MFKKAVSFTLILFVLITVFQWLAKPTINWVDNIGVAVIAFLIYILVEWAIKPSKRAH
ncbi:hypothetical protein HNO89_002726 [Sporosarcina luteola]|nr:hypothetical protein [Sporosarcina luteola]